tara:strand:+ start:2200 stop:3042 length:843 start_codon:yes stop_codon:yes gene_type:complete
VTKNTFLILFFLFASSCLFSQPGYDYHNFSLHPEEAYKHLIADNVNIRDIPSTKGKIVAKLPIASYVKILEKTDYTLTLKGFTSNWYKVSFGNLQDIRNDKNIGYVWGGMISYKTVYIGGAESYDNDIVAYHFGVHSVITENGFQDEGLFQIRVSKNNKQLDKLVTQQMPFDVSFNLESLGSKGLKNIDDIFSVHQYQEKCDGVDYKQILILDAGKLYNITDLESGGYEDEWHEEYVIYPDDERGSPNTIIIVHDSYYRGERDIEFKKFRWNGVALIEIE